MLSRDFKNRAEARSSAPPPEQVVYRSVPLPHLQNKGAFLPQESPMASTVPSTQRVFNKQ